MGALKVLLAAVVLLSASGCISAVSEELQGWLGDPLLPPNATTWICHFRLSGEEFGGVVKTDNCPSSCPASSTNNHSSSKNVTAAPPQHHHNKQYLGYIGAIIAILFFGSNFIPVKKYETGDGVFFQWVMCIGIWLVGLVVNFSLDSPPFFLPAVIGGFFWTTGNMMVVPIIQMIGMTMGLTVWGVTNMLGGWVAGRFILNQHVHCEGLNYGGVATVVFSVVILAFVKSEGKKLPDAENPSERTPLLRDQSPTLEGSLKDKMLQRKSRATSPTSIQSPEEKVTFSDSSLITRGTSGDAQPESWTDKLGVWPKRILGFSLSLVAGVFFSLLFLPVQYLKLCHDSVHTCADMDYLFGVFSGILFTSTSYFIIYTLVKCNRPKVYYDVIVPGIVSGILWGIAMTGWFLANQYLSSSITFPLVTAGPGFVSSLWGIAVYREIRGWRNLTLFIVAFFVSLAGQVMNGLSQCTDC